MMEKISVLESKLAQLHSDDLSSQMTVMELLSKINERLDHLGKHSSHSCCGGPVVIQTTPHANVVHQPILDSCSSCRDSKKEKRTVSSASVSSEKNTCLTLQERNDHICATSLNAISIRSSSDMENAADKNLSGNRPGVILVPDSQNELSPKSRTVTYCMPSTQVTSRLHSMSSAVVSPALENKQGSLLTSVSHKPDSEVNISDSSKQVLSGNSKPSPNGDGCCMIVRQDNSLPNGSNCITPTVQSLIATTASGTSSTTAVSSVVKQSKDSSYHIEHMRNLASPPQQLNIPGSSHPAPIQIIRSPAPSRQSPHIEHQTGTVPNHIDKNEPAHKPGQDQVSEIEPHHLRPASVCPVPINTVVRSPVTHYYPVGASAGPSHYLPQHAVLVVSSSGACISSQNSSVLHSARTPQAPPTSVQKNVPPGYITLSHTPNVMPSVNKVHMTPAWQPQTVMSTTASHSTQQRKELLVSPAAGAAMQRSGKYSVNDSQHTKLICKPMLL